MTDAPICPGCAQTAKESGVPVPTTQTCPGCVAAMATYIAELEAQVETLEGRIAGLTSR